MNKLVLTVLCVAATFAAFADATVPAKPADGTNAVKRLTKEEFNKLPPEEQARIKEERRERRLMRTGGMIRDTRNQAGKLLVVNAQKSVDFAPAREALGKILAHLRVSADIVELASVDYGKLVELRKEKGAAAVLVIGSCGDKPLLLLAPEERWAVLNADKIGNKNQGDRLKKEAARAFSHLCGGIMSQFPNPMTYPIADARSLDMIEVPELPIDVLNRMEKSLPLMGVTPYEETFYREACKEGWAPAPTNKYQKAVWDQVHELPSKPLPLTK